MATADSVTKEAKSLSIGALRDKVRRMSADCGTLNARLGGLMADPDHYAAEITATRNAIDLACTWSSIGAAVLAQREMEAATKTAAAAARKAASTQTKPATSAAAAGADAGASVVPYEEPSKTPWGWILGAGVLGLGALGLIMRKQPAVVRVVRTVGSKVRR